MNCRLRKRLHRILPAQGAEGARHRQRCDCGYQHRALGLRQEAQERLPRRLSRLLSELISIEPTYSMVWTPDAETEDARDLIRARLDAVAALKSSWTREYVSWAKSADLGGGHAKEVLCFCIQTVEENHERVRALDRRPIAMSELPKSKPGMLLCMLQLGLLLAVGEDIRSWRPSSWAAALASRTRCGRGVWFRRRLWPAGTVSGALVRGATLYNFSNPSLT